MKNVLTVLILLICLLLLNGCYGFSVFCIQETNSNTKELEILTLKIHYVTQYGEIIEIYEYKKKEESNADGNIS